MVTGKNNFQTNLLTFHFEIVLQLCFITTTFLHPVYFIMCANHLNWYDFIKPTKMLPSTNETHYNLNTSKNNSLLSSFTGTTCLECVFQRVFQFKAVFELEITWSTETYFCLLTFTYSHFRSFFCFLSILEENVWLFSCYMLYYVHLLLCLPIVWWTGNAQWVFTAFMLNTVSYYSLKLS